MLAMEAYYLNPTPPNHVKAMVDTAPARKAESLAKSDPLRNCL